MVVKKITPVYVEFIPEIIEEGKLYVSETYQTAIHKCCCGCGEEVVTPLSPVDWQLKKNMDTISLRPSIGNWNYSCKSHYFITNNQVIWANRFTQKQIANIQKKDKLDKQNYIDSKNKQIINSLLNDDNWLSKIWKSIKSLFRS
ncbi:hypothetical protein H0920_01220 [Acinetobacter sp. C_4_1]|uniref:DUF6527 family protein n=1 Tax=unclassified Acinetobacter TaxID=196816 RepID=UPI0021B78078|nr:MULTISPECIES: DUF6527 family protein [unclassified Acinetobacter]MCT8088714.1 hypothetical protein [Acinetobacter sp. F_3_1]MCT8096870.1 hypothetical protein [Acinetobacter sp. C_3_1]MCT8099745.1 hypothetical protein [Acinetobacter sp. C_4_1]MCT8133713.1 hypothetical protein [Acinetobacter sp. T_3_1]